MSTQAISRTTRKVPALFDDFFRPWNEWFDNSSGPWGQVLNVPAVNITEGKNEYQVSLAIPGMKKENFKIDLDGNLLTISSEKEENKEETDKRFTRKEYNYSSFSRSFNLPDEVDKEKIEAAYADGILKVSLPRKTQAKENISKKVVVK